jgi:uncharacterized membrane protein
MARSASAVDRTDDMNFSKAELAIILGQAVGLTIALVAAMLFDVYAPGWMWN